MSEPFLGEIRLFPYGLVPRDWLACEGQILPISQNQALFSILGVYYGGNGTTNFALPDLRGRVAIGTGNASGTSYTIGEIGGETGHALTTAEIPQHNHMVTASATDATVAALAPGVPATWAGSTNEYGPPASLAPMASNAVAAAGGGMPHQNMQPYLAMTYCIALQGIYPSRP